MQTPDFIAPVRFDDPAAALDRKVFKQKGLAVGDMETAQRVRRGLEVPLNAETIQVVIKPHA